METLWVPGLWADGLWAEGLWVGEGSSQPLSIIIDQGGLVTIPEGRTVQLTATVEGTEDPASWDTANAAIATVDANGLVTAVAQGETIVTASVVGSEGGAQDTITIRVIPVVAPIPPVFGRRPGRRFAYL